MRLQVKQLLTDAFSQSSDGELNRWIKRVSGLVAGHRLVDLMTQNRIYVDDVTVDVASLHRLDRLTCAQNVSDQLAVDDVFDLFRVVVVGQKGFRENAAVVHEQIHASEGFLNPRKCLRHGLLVCDVTLDSIQLSFDLQQSDAQRFNFVLSVCCFVMDLL